MTELEKAHARIEELEAQEVELCTLYGIVQAENGKLRAELAAMRATVEPVAEMVPFHTPSGKRVAVISRFQHLPIGTKLYTHPSPPEGMAAEQALLKVLAAVQRYLPPDGPSAHDTLTEIIEVVDPWPLGQLDKS